MSRVRPVLAAAVAVLAVCAGAPVAAPAHATTAWQPEAATYDVVTLTDIPLTMRDGVILRANVGIPVPKGTTAPVAGQRFPVLIEQTPYRKDGGLFGVDSYFVQRGFAFVIVDVRGTGSSQGQWQSFGAAEQADGPEIVRWTAKQSWSNGTAGLLGASYLAINQFLTMEQDNAPTDIVKAIFPVVPMSDSFRDVTFHGGNFDDAFMAPWLGLVTGLGLPPANPATSGNPQDIAYAGSVLSDHLQGATNFQAQLVPQVIVGGPRAFDGPDYRINSPIERVDRVHVPTFIVGGEFDIFQRGEPLLYSRLNATKRMILGPWVHLEGSSAGSLPADGIPDLHTLQLQWFDQYLRGENTGEEQAPRVLQYELKGQNPSHFVASPTWPMPGMHPVNLYLDGTTSGSATSLNDGSLVSAPPSAAGSDMLVYDPTGTPCSRTTFQWGDASTTQAQGNGGTNNVPCENDERPNEVHELTYSTPALAKPVTINGPINVHLTAENPLGRDSFFTVRVTDVDPSGASTQLSAGWLLASMRATVPSTWSMAQDGELLRPFHPFTAASQQTPPAAPTAYDIEVFPTYATFDTGHRIRLDIATGDAPHTVQTVPGQAASAGALFNVDRGGANLSYVTLPMIAPPGAASGIGAAIPPSASAPHAGAPTTTSTSPAGIPNTTAPAPGTAVAIVALAMIPAAGLWRRRRRT
jgi:putative CocE/NonD family hydrolase